MLDELLSNIQTYFGEYGLEMKAIAEYFGIDLGIVVTINLSYELRRVRLIWWLFSYLCKSQAEFLV